jgi:Ca2+-binding RTX toxin-like protein
VSDPNIVPVVVLAGQSNAEITAMDDQIVAALQAQGNGFEFVKTAVAGTTIFPFRGRDWSASSSGDLLAMSIASVQRAIDNVLAQGKIPQLTIVWSQGETDVSSTQQRYADALTALIASYRSDLAMPDADFVIVMMPDENGVRNAQFQVAGQTENVYLIETRGLERVDPVHFSSASIAVIVEDLLDQTGLHASSIAGYAPLYNQTSITQVSPNQFEVVLPENYDGYFKWVQGTDPSNAAYHVTGGWGADRIFTGPKDDYVDGGPGIDQIVTGDGNDTIYGGWGNDYLAGGRGDDEIHGGDDLDTIWGGQGNDVLYGDEVLDFIYGEDGNDTIVGGLGPDRLYGGAGADTFLYLSADESYVYPYASNFFGFDTIYDFTLGEDRIDVSALGQLLFVGTAAFSGTAPELRYSYSGNNTLITADLDANGTSDFQIQLIGKIALTADSFVLTDYVPPGPSVPIVVLAGQTNAEFTAIDDALIAGLSAKGNAFEFVKLADQNSSLFKNAGRDWSATSSGDLLDQLVAATLQAIGKVEAAGGTPEVSLLWVQGEADRYASQASYAAALEGFIGAFRAGIGMPDAEISISLLPTASGARSAQIQVAGSMANVETIETQGLSTTNGLNYSASSAQTIASRFLTQIDPHVSTVAGYDALYDDVKIVTYADRIEVTGPNYADFTFTYSSTLPYVVHSGYGIDVIRTGIGNDTVYSGGGPDQILTGDGNDTIYSGDGNDYVFGGRGNDAIYSGDDIDTVYGGEGNDLLDLGAWGDYGYGDAGNDTLIGGSGGDFLWGGAGADTFVYLAASDSYDYGAPSAAFGFDTIGDFTMGEDKIDLTALGGLLFVGTAAFSGTAPELRYSYSGGNTFVTADLDGNGTSDFQIKLTGQIALTRDAFTMTEYVAPQPSTVPIVVLAGQTNAEFTAIDDALIAGLSAKGNAFEFVKLADQNSSLFKNAGRDWSATSSGDLLDQLVAATLQAIGKVEAAGGTPEVSLLWVQGEADRYASQASYAAALEGFIGAFRAGIGMPDAEISISLLPTASGARSAQIQVAGSMANVETIETQGLSTTNGLNYSASSAQTIASRFLTQIDPHVSTVAGYDALYDDVKIVTYADRIEVTGPNYADFTFTYSSTLPYVVHSGYGIDVIRTGIGNDTVYSGGGPDQILTGDGNDTIYSGDGNDYVFGGRGNDAIYSGDDIDTVYGGEGNDLLDLGAWGDYGYGDAGNDTLIGGSGGDFLWGGAGADTFVYLAASDSYDYGAPSAAFGFDTIGDFTMGEDKIDLSALGTLSFVGNGAFDGTAGQVRFEVGSNVTDVYVDIDGNGAADMHIRLTGALQMAANDFVL